MIDKAESPSLNASASSSLSPTLAHNMSRYIVLLRGVNVGGHNFLPMKELKSALEAAGYKNVGTYIQSGNLVLDSEHDPMLAIKALIAGKFGFDPDVLTLTQQQFKKAIVNNPYLGFEGKWVHFYFCQQEPKLDLQRLTQLKADTASCQMIPRVFYLHAPMGIARSKLVANIEKCLGVRATGRNLNTVHKLANMLNIKSDE